MSPGVSFLPAVKFLVVEKYLSSSVLLPHSSPRFPCGCSCLLPRPLHGTEHPGKSGEEEDHTAGVDNREEEEEEEEERV